MRSLAHPPPAADATAAAAARSDAATLRRLFPYLWQYKWRVFAALAFMVGAKVANVGVPWKEIADASFAVTSHVETARRTKRCDFIDSAERLAARSDIGGSNRRRRTEANASRVSALA